MRRRRRQRNGAALTAAQQTGGGAGGADAAIAGELSPLAALRTTANPSFRPAALGSARAVVMPPLPAARAAAAAAVPDVLAVTPAAAESEDAATQGLLPDWEAVWSRSKQTYYYRHKESGEVQWNKPSSEPADSLWVEHMSRSKGRPYWKHKYTGETTWSRP